MKPWSDQEARWIRRAAEDAIRERRPPGHELGAEEEREAWEDRRGRDGG